MSRYQLTAAARLDLLQIWNYLAERGSLEIADRVLADIEAGIRLLVKSPSLGHSRADLSDHPVFFYRVHTYLIVYRSKIKPLHIVRVLHSSRDIKSILQ